MHGRPLSGTSAHPLSRPPAHPRAHPRSRALADVANGFHPPMCPRSRALGQVPARCVAALLASQPHTSTTAASAVSGGSGSPSTAAAGSAQATSADPWSQLALRIVATCHRLLNRVLDCFDEGGPPPAGRVLRGAFGWQDVTKDRPCGHARRRHCQAAGGGSIRAGTGLHPSTSRRRLARAAGASTVQRLVRSADPPAPVRVPALAPTKTIHSPTKAPLPPCNRTPFNVQVAIPADALLGLIQRVVNINAYTPVPRAPPCVPPCLLHADC